jgi:hypothetical protein
MSALVASVTKNQNPSDPTLWPQLLRHQTDNHFGRRQHPLIGLRMILGLRQQMKSLIENIFRDTRKIGTGKRKGCRKD